MNASRRNRRQWINPINLDRKVGSWFPLLAASRALEAVSKLPQRNEEASHMEKGTIYFDVVFMANQEATEVSLPGDGALAFPRSWIASRLPTVLKFRFLSLGPVGAEQVFPPFFQACSAGTGVTGFAVNHSRLAAPGTTASL